MRSTRPNATTITIAAGKPTTPFACTPFVAPPTSPAETVLAIPHLFTLILSNLPRIDLARAALVNRTWFSFAAADLYSVLCIPQFNTVVATKLSQWQPWHSVERGGAFLDLRTHLPWPLNVLVRELSERDGQKGPGKGTTEGEGGADGESAEQGTEGSKELPGVKWARQHALERIRTVRIVPHDADQCKPLSCLRTILARRSHPLPRVELLLAQKDDSSHCALLSALSARTVHLYRSQTCDRRAHIDILNSTTHERQRLRGSGLIQKLFIELDDLSYPEHASRSGFARTTVLILPPQGRGWGSNQTYSSKVAEHVQALRAVTWEKLVLVSARFKGTETVGQPGKTRASASASASASTNRPSTSTSTSRLQKAVVGRVLEIQSGRPRVSPVPEVVLMGVEAYRASALWERDEDEALDKISRGIC